MSAHLHWHLPGSVDCCFQDGRSGGSEVGESELDPFPGSSTPPPSVQSLSTHSTPEDGDHAGSEGGSSRGTCRWSLKVVVWVRVRVGEKPSCEFRLLAISLFVHGFSPNLEVFILLWVEVCHKLWILLNCQIIGLIGDNRVPGSLKVVVGKAELRAESGF